jgi:predicted phosphodiesterase
VLREARPLRRLCEAVADADRVVLLGDVVELRHGPARDALSAAAPVLSALGAAVGADGEVVIVPGNHDHDLVEPWFARSSRSRPAPPLGLEATVDWRAGETLATIARRLGPAAVRVSYPGLWLRDDVYATHGHYCDRHTTVPMFERLGAGAMARIVREPDGGPASAEDYERVLAPIYAWIHALAEHRGPEIGQSSHGPSTQAWRVLARRRGGVRRYALAAGFGAAVAAINRIGLGPVRTDLSGPALRRASLTAFGEVVSRLGVQAAWVVFGHSHRAGPLPTDDGSEWRTPGGASILNTGCWVHEPSFVGPDPARSPYRAGFAVRIADEAPPELVNLLD